MKSLGDVLGGGVTETLPCARCTNPNEVSASTIELAREMNRHRKSMGIPMVQKHQIALCEYCYGIHHRELATGRSRDVEHDDELWGQWIDGDVFHVQTERRLFGMMRNPDEYKDLKFRVLEKRRGRTDHKRQKGLLR